MSIFTFKHELQCTSSPGIWRMHQIFHLYHNHVGHLYNSPSMISQKDFEYSFQVSPLLLEVVQAVLFHEPYILALLRDGRLLGEKKALFMLQCLRITNGSLYFL